MLGPGVAIRITKKAKSRAAVDHGTDDALHDRKTGKRTEKALRQILPSSLPIQLPCGCMSGREAR